MININEIAKKVLGEIESLDAKANADIHYCRGAKDGVNRMVQDIQAALAPKPEAAADAKPKRTKTK